MAKRTAIDRPGVCIDRCIKLSEYETNMTGERIDSAAAFSGVRASFITIVQERDKLL